MSNRDQGVGPRKTNKTGPTIHDIRVDNSPLPPDRARLEIFQLSSGVGRVPKSQVRGDGFSFTLADPAVARLIVESVNSHSSLLARVERLEGALKEVLRVVGDCYLDGPLPDFMRLAVANARAALSNHSPAGEGANNG